VVFRLSVLVISPCDNTANGNKINPEIIFAINICFGCKLKFIIHAAKPENCHLSCRKIRAVV
jgi:hypothetical protein